ncbi:hypothetical protein EDB83DRAFT_2323102 [Lactarius deliciosus]|nr:hypothetical protein EDB83DRAFT_2323102 [Lactarius deliciosus]
MWLVSPLSLLSWWWSWWWSLLFGVASVFASPSPLLGWRRCASHLTFAAQARSDLRCQWWGGGGVGWRLDQLIGEVLMSSLMSSLVKGTQPSQLSHSSLKCTAGLFAARALSTCCAILLSININNNRPRPRLPDAAPSCTRYRQPPGPCQCSGPNPDDGNHDTTTRRHRLPQRLGDSQQQGSNKNQGGGVNGNSNDNSKTDDDDDQDSDSDGYDHDYNYVT